jgi:hypothetical protein
LDKTLPNSILSSLGAGAKKLGHAVTSGAKTVTPYAKRALKFGERAAKYGEKVATHVGKAAEEGLATAGRISRAYSGEVAPREELEHEERIATIRARRPPPPPVTREIVREQNVPFGGTSSPLLSQPMQEEVRRAKWRRESRRAAPVSLRRARKPTKWRTRKTRSSSSQRTMTNGGEKEKIRDRVKRGYKSIKEWAKEPTPELYKKKSLRERLQDLRKKKKGNPTSLTQRLSQGGI